MKGIFELFFFCFSGSGGKGRKDSGSWEGDCRVCGSCGWVRGGYSNDLRGVSSIGGRLVSGLEDERCRELHAGGSQGDGE